MCSYARFVTAILLLAIGSIPVAAQTSCSSASQSRTHWCTKNTRGFHSETINGMTSNLVWVGEDYLTTNYRKQVVTEVYKFKAITATGLFARGAIFQVHASCGPRCTATVRPNRVNIRLGHVPSVRITYRNSDVQPTTHTPIMTLYMEGAAPRPNWRKSHQYRCDGVIRNISPGCVIPDYDPVEMRQAQLKYISQNIAIGQSKPMHYGKVGFDRPLHYNPPRADANRRVMCPASRPRVTGWSCDEYPFATTSEGGGVSFPDNASVMDVPIREQNQQGGRWNAFLQQNRVLPYRPINGNVKEFVGDPVYVYVP